MLTGWRSPGVRGEGKKHLLLHIVALCYRGTNRAASVVQVSGDTEGQTQQCCTGVTEGQTQQCCTGVTEGQTQQSVLYRCQVTLRDRHSSQCCTGVRCH